MRTILFVILAAAVAAGGFAVYWKVQPPLTQLLGDGTPAAPVHMNPDRPSQSGMIHGDQPWSKQFDKQGQLASRMRADDVQPLGNGRVRVTDVVSQFFQHFKADPKNPDPAKHVERTQVIQIKGKWGDLEMQDSADGASQTMKGGASGTPRRGRLNDVVIKLFRDAADLAAEDAGRDGPGPMLTMVTNNIAFDNESFEMSTEAYRDAAGRHIPADQVPIHVTGDYDFDGRGLKLRWNEVEGRLEYLEVAHGERLVIHHPDGQFSPNPGAGDGANGAKPIAATFGGRAFEFAPDGALRDSAGVPIMLAAKDKKLPPGAVPPAPAAKTPAAGARKPGGGKKNAPEKAEHHGPQPPYRATFTDEVRVTQGQENLAETELAVADEMTVDFQMAGGQKPTTAPSTRPTTGPAAQPASAAAAAPGATTNPVVASATEPGPTTESTTKPTTQPAGEPVIVRWSGPLRIVPIEAADPQPPVGLKPGDAILRLLGTRAPVLLTRDNSRVRCAKVEYFSVDGSAAVWSSPQFPEVVLTQAPSPDDRPATRPADAAGGGVQDATITTESMLYSGVHHVAVLNGKGRALVGLAPAGPTTRPDGAGPVAKADDRMDARWTKSATLQLTPPAGAAAAKDKEDAKAGGGSQGGMQIQHATLVGDVDVKHPQLALQSSTLDLEFDPAAPATRPAHAGPTTQPNKADKDRQPTLRRLVATERVLCDLKGQDGKQQSIDCDVLTMDTDLAADGKVYPKVVHADGHARAYDATQDLTAGHIDFTLAPTTRPAGPATRPTTGPATPEAKADAASATTRPALAGGGLGAVAVELRTMTARDDVTARTTDGSVATGAEMYVQMVDGQPHARLVGRPNAQVVDAKQTVITGPVIRFDPKQNIAHVDGRGSIKAMRQSDDPQAPPRPVDIAFRDGAELNGPKNRIHVRGPVAVVSPDADGSVNTATATRIEVELVDAPAPTTRPTTGPSSARPATLAQASGATSSSTGVPATGVPATGPATGPATRPHKPHGDKAAATPGLADGAQMNVMKDKAVSAIVLDENAVVKSTLAAPDGSILREFELKSSLIRYEMLGAGAPLSAAGGLGSLGAAPGSGQMARLVVPRPGQMLVRDHRTPAEKPADKSADKGGKPADAEFDPNHARGAMAFQWGRSMVYDETKRLATFDKDVVIVHQPDEANEPPGRLDADQVYAWFEPRLVPPEDNKAAKPTTKPAGKPGADQPGPLQLKWLTAMGRVNVTRAGSTMSGNRLDYDPATAWMVATGGPNAPATFNEAASRQFGSADQILWNTRTWQFKSRNLSARGNEQNASSKEVKVPGAASPRR